MQMQVLEQSLKASPEPKNQVVEDMQRATLDAIFKSKEPDKEGKRALLEAILDQTKQKSKACRLLYKY